MFREAGSEFGYCLEEFMERTISGEFEVLRYPLCLRVSVVKTDLPTTNAGVTNKKATLADRL